MAHLLSEAQLKHYREEGFLVIEKFFDVENEMKPVMKCISDMVDDLANDLYGAGLIKNLHKEEGFYTRLTKLEEEFSGAAVLMHKRNILPKPLQELWSNPRLLDIISQLLESEEILAHPNWSLRTKTPLNPLVTVPWHQDAAYSQEGSEHTFMPTAWIPFVDAKKENGCMQVLRKGHQKQVLLDHVCCSGKSWYLELPEETMFGNLGSKEDVVLCEVPLGGMLLINQLIPHRSLENLSDKIRWSVDLRWQRPGEPHGFTGIKEPLMVRKKNDPNYKPDWESWSKIDRIQVFQTTENNDHTHDKFSTVITGPWIKRWKVVNHNQHTEALK